MAVLRNSDGSSEWRVETETLPDIRLISSVNGPLEVKYRDELPTQASVELIIRPATGLPTFREVWLQDRVFKCIDAIMLRDAIPRSLVQVVIQVLEGRDLWRELSGCINVLSLALVSAGIPLKALVAAVTVWTDDVHASERPFQDAQAQHTIAFKFSNGPDELVQELTFCESNGSFSWQILRKAIELAESLTNSIYRSMRESVGEEAQDRFVWKE